VDERARAEVVEGEGALRGADEDLVEVGRGMEEVGCGEGGREGNSELEVYAQGRLAR
jgi:hypothetical protein